MRIDAGIEQEALNNKEHERQRIAIECVCREVGKGNAAAVRLAGRLLLADIGPWPLGVLANCFRKSQENPSEGFLAALEKVAGQLEKIPDDVGWEVLCIFLKSLHRISGTIAMKGLPEALRLRTEAVKKRLDSLLSPDLEYRQSILDRLGIAIEGKKVKSSQLPHP
jgi:hypothetical protein